MGTSEHWHKAAEIATKASELPSEEIIPFLDRECRDASDSGLRRGVEALLATRDQTIDGPAHGPPDSTVVVRSPESIGPYRLIRSLGKGGMGEVFLARQTTPIERDVAIKLIQSTFSGRAAHRFELERRALARMSHPFIAQVYEAGDTADRRPYLVMERVEGTSIDDYCDSQRRSISERLELFAMVCDGIHHAHQKGVLHRDVKPENILVTEVDGQAIPKIIDFGIAKSFGGEADDSGRHLTRIGTLVGTPAYLSPETINRAGDIDIRTDVYALGILLYRLLVGVLPFKGDTANVLEIIRLISEQDAPTPSNLFTGLDGQERKARADLRGGVAPQTLLNKLGSDLDAIAQMAVARNRDDRYGSAAQLAQDVRRFLADLPVDAKPHSGWYKAKKFVRRHRAAAAAAVLVLLSLVGGLIARTLEARRADHAAAEARNAQRETEQVVDFMVDLFEISDPARSLGASITARELLDRGATRVRRELADQPLTRARLLDTVGVVYEKLGLHSKAAALLEEGLAEREKHSSNPLDVADSLTHLGFVRWIQVDTESAQRLYSRALSIRRRELGPDHPLVADLLDKLGTVHEVDGDYVEADRLLNQALAIRERHFGQHSQQVAETLGNLATSALNQGEHSTSESLQRRALAIKEKLFGPDHPAAARTLNGLALPISRLGRNEEAEGLLRRALEIRETVLGPNHTEVAQVLNNLATVVAEQGRHDESLALMQQALGVLEVALGEDNATTGISVYNLGDSYFESGAYDQAEPFLRRAHAIFQQAYSPEHPHVAYAAKRLADLLKETDRFEEGEQLYRQALAIRRDKLPAGHSQTALTAHGLADLLRRRGLDAEATELENAFPSSD